ncbi:MAG: Spy/CpxP family protein refolding chaperone [Desulfobacteraceae bacterium]
MKRIIIISSAAVCVALIGLAFAAGPGSGGWHRTPEEKVAYITSKIAEKLALDDAQRAALDRIADEFIAEHQRISSDRQVFKADFIEILGKEEVSPEELNALFDTKKPLIEEMMQLASVHIAEFHSILTPEQRATLIAEIESHEGRRCRLFR